MRTRARTRTPRCFPRTARVLHHRLSSAHAIAARGKITLTWPRLRARPPRLPGAIGGWSGHVSQAARNSDREPGERGKRTIWGTSARDVDHRSRIKRGRIPITIGLAMDAETTPRTGGDRRRRSASGDFGEARWLRLPQSREGWRTRAGERGQSRPVTRRFRRPSVPPPSPGLLAWPAGWPRNRYARHEVLYLNRPVFKAASPPATAADFPRSRPRGIAQRRDARVRRLYSSRGL